MLDKNSFARLFADFVESQDLVEIAHDRRRCMKFVCHHDSYLAAGFLRRRGHEDIRWVSGYYRSHESVNPIRHSWITLTIEGKTAAIFEVDPRQLHKRGGYENDPMPSGHIPEFSMTISPIASIIDPELVDLPDDAKDCRWVVQSKEVLMRFVENEACAPDIDLNDLDKLGLEAQVDFDASRELLKECNPE